MSNKKWSSYTKEEKNHMRTEVIKAGEDDFFPPQYAAAYLGKSPSTLQYWRCNKSKDTITYIKAGRHILYKKKHLDEYLERCERLCTINY